MKQLIILAFLVSINSFSQKLELGNVTVEELNQKNHTIDSSAVSAIVFKKGQVSFEFSQQDGFYIETKIKLKIKIYKKGGTDWGTFKIPLYSKSNAKQTLDIKSAVTYNLVDNRIEKSKLKSDGEFLEKINEFWSEKKIIMPNVKEGSIIEIEYAIIDIGMGAIDEWEFQHEIPVDYIEYTTIIPEYYVYNTHFRGWLTPKITKIQNTRNIELNNKERVTSRVTARNGAGGGYSESSNFTQEEVKYSQTQTTFLLENVPAIINESYVSNIKNYTSSVVHELAQTKFPNQMEQNFSSDWETITKKIYDYDDFGPELKKTEYFENDINIILKDVISLKDKIAIIFNFVKNRMNFNDRYGYGCLSGVKKAYQDKTGNVAEINLMLASMLRFAGVNANPVLISTRSNGIALYPSRSAFNYVIVGIELDNQIILIDATSKNSIADILPTRDLNWYGRIIRENGTSASVNLMPKNISNDKVVVMAKIDETGIVEGKLRDQYFDYNAYFFRENNSKLSNESQIEKLEKSYQGIEISDYSVTNINVLDKPITQSFSFKHNNLVEIIGDKMYIAPLLFFEKTENPFKQETRNYPVDYSIPFSDTFNISINIPAGYEVDFIPEKINMAMEDNYGFFLFSISSSANILQISSSFSVNSSVIPAEKYGMLKDFYKLMIEKQTEKIVLRKMK